MLSLEDDPAFSLARTLSSDDLREAVRDFLEKRWTPVNHGKVRFEIDADGEIVAKIFERKLRLVR